MGCVKSEWVTTAGSKVAPHLSSMADRSCTNREMYMECMYILTYVLDSADTTLLTVNHSVVFSHSYPGDFLGEMRVMCSLEIVWQCVLLYNHYYTHTREH